MGTKTILPEVEMPTWANPYQYLSYNEEKHLSDPVLVRTLRRHGHAAHLQLPDKVHIKTLPEGTVGYITINEDDSYSVHITTNEHFKCLYWRNPVEWVKIETQWWVNRLKFFGFKVKTFAFPEIIDVLEGDFNIPQGATNQYNCSNIIKLEGDFNIPQDV